MLLGVSLAVYPAVTVFYRLRRLNQSLFAGPRRDELRVTPYRPVDLFRLFYLPELRRPLRILGLLILYFLLCTVEAYLNPTSVYRIGGSVFSTFSAILSWLLSLLVVAPAVALDLWLLGRSRVFERRLWGACYPLVAVTAWVGAVLVQGLVFARFSPSAAVACCALYTSGTVLLLISGAWTLFRKGLNAES